MKRIYFLLFTLLTFKAVAQSNQLYFEHLNVAEGLPEASITAMRQDKFGYVWLGTQNGLVRYDGYQVKVYKLGEHEKDTPKDYAVNDIFEDKQGTLWVLDRVNNLYRYNRSLDSFKQYKLDEKSMLYGYHNRMIQDERGDIWIYGNFSPSRESTHLQRFDPVTGRAVNFPYIPYSACKAHDGTLWFGTDKGLAHYSPANAKLIIEPLPPGKGGQTLKITTIYEAPSMPGVLWFSTFMPAQGLFSFDVNSKQLTSYPHRSETTRSILSDTVLKIFEDNSHSLWFGTPRGISVINGANKNFVNYNFPNTVSNKLGPYNVVEQSDGKFWIAFNTSRQSNNGLLLFDPRTGKFRQYQHDKNDPNSLATSTVSKLMIDRAGTLWTGNAWGGADRVNTLRSGFHLYKSMPGSQTGYPAGGIEGIAQAKDGYCWMGSDEGLIRWKPDSSVFEREKLPAYLSGGRLRVLYADKDGLIWCANAKAKLFSYDPKNQKAEPAINAEKIHGSANVCFQDRSGLLWIGADTGLYTYNKSNKEFKVLPYEEKRITGRNYQGKKLDNQMVFSITQDHAGTIWVGTNNGGLNRYNPQDNTFRSFYDLYKGFFCVTAIHEAKDGRFWVGTYLDGLFLFDRKTGNTRRFSEEDGMLHASVGGLMEDDAGMLWTFSERGLTRFDPYKNNFSAYTTANALPVGINKLRTSDAIKTAGDELLIGTNDGLIAFYPGKLLRNQHPPLVYVESITHNDPRAVKDSTSKVIMLDKTKIDLPYDQNRITFNYIAFHYEHPTQNKYAYQLSGYDKNWVQAGRQRSVTYTNLSPGTYTFRVKAANSDGVWNEQGALVTVVISPPWWGTWWAWIIYVLVFAGAVYAFIQYRSRKLLHDNKVLEHKVHLRTEEVLQQKEEIEAQRDELEHTIDQLKSTQTQLIQSEKMASLGELTAGIAHEIQNPLNFVNNFSEVNTELIDEMEEEIAKGRLDEVKAIAADIKDNQLKINQHGKRADFIVKGMLQHSRKSSGEKQPTNMNVLCDEFLKLSFHGLRARDKSFNAEMVTHFDSNLPSVNVSQQDIGRVMLNLFNNAFYAVNQKAKTAAPGYKPTVEVSTTQQDGSVIISVKDNGNGIPEAIKDKIMQPFFTTKPTGEGTGLGLSLSYDIVVKGHGGNIHLDTKEGEYTEFKINLPV